MLIYDLLPAGEELPNLREMMRRVVAYNDAQTGALDETGVAPMFQCFIAADGALKFEALVMPADVRRNITAMLNQYKREMHLFTDALMAEPQP